MISNPPRTRPSISLRNLGIATLGASLAAGVACSGSPQAVAPTPAPPTAKSDRQDGNTRTLQASVEDALSLNASAMNGSITVVRDSAAKAMQVTAVVGGPGWDLSEGRRTEILAAATLVASKDASGRVAVRVDFPGFSNDLPNVEITVRTPALSAVEAKTMNGSIRIEGDLGDVRAETMNGTVDVAGAKSKVVAKSTNGEVTIGLAEGATASVEAECANGKVALDLPSSWNGTVDASVTNGAVTAAGIKGTSERSWTGEDFTGTAGSGGTAKARLAVVNGSVKVRRR